jgi:hypothetical protein
MFFPILSYYSKIKMFCKMKNFCSNIWMTSSKCIVNWFHHLVFIKMNVKHLPCSFFYWINNWHKKKSIAYIPKYLGFSMTRKSSFTLLCHTCHNLCIYMFCNKTICPYLIFNLAQTHVAQQTQKPNDLFLNSNM